jgi:hypothetical protein
MVFQQHAVLLENPDDAVEAAFESVDAILQAHASSV